MEKQPGCASIVLCGKSDDKNISLARKSGSNVYLLEDPKYSAPTKIDGCENVIVNYDDRTDVISKILESAKPFNVADIKIGCMDGNRLKYSMAGAIIYSAGVLELTGRGVRVICPTTQYDRSWAEEIVQLPTKRELSKESMKVIRKVELPQYAIKKKDSVTLMKDKLATLEGVRNGKAIVRLTETGRFIKQLEA